MKIIVRNHYNNNYRMIDSFPTAHFPIGKIPHFDGVYAEFKKIGDDLACVIEVRSNEFTDDEKIEFIKAFHQELKKRGMAIDATLCSDSDCTGMADFKKFNREIKKIDHRIDTVEAGLIGREASADNHFTNDSGDEFADDRADFVKKFTALLESRPAQNFSAEETCDLVSKAYNSALQSVQRINSTKR